MSGWLASRAIVAAAPQHVTIAGRSTRIDIQLEHSFPTEALCRAMQQGLQAFAALTGENTSALGQQLTAAGLIEPAPSQPVRVPGTIPLADALRLEDKGLTRGCVIYTADEAFSARERSGPCPRRIPAVRIPPGRHRPVRRLRAAGSRPGRPHHR